MSENLYAAPEAVITDGAERVPFHVVSTRKFVILMVATVGMYALYWFYRNWAQYRDYSGNRLWPIPRAIFAVFFVNALFRHVSEEAGRRGVEIPFRQATSTFQYVAIYLVSFVLNQLSQRDIGSPLTDLAGIAMGLLLIWVLVPVQGGINRVCADIASDANDQITAINGLWILLGIVLWVLVVIGVSVKF